MVVVGISDSICESNCREFVVKVCGWTASFARQLDGKNNGQLQATFSFASRYGNPDHTEQFPLRRPATFAGPGGKPRHLLVQPDAQRPPRFQRGVIRSPVLRPVSLCGWLRHLQVCSKTNPPSSNRCTRVMQQSRYRHLFWSNLITKIRFD